MKGIIKKIMGDGKLFGFITPENGGKDIFFHANSVVGVQFAELREGDNVTFETEENEKGMNAVNVQKA